MQNTAPHFRSTRGQNGRQFSSPDDYALEVERLPRLIEDWLSDGQISQHSPRTIDYRRMLGERLTWFLHHEEHRVCSRSELRRFFAYLSGDHHREGGRWEQARYAKPLKPATVKSYYRHLSSFFNWLVREEILHESPLAKMSAPISREDQIQPFTLEQVESLIAAAKRSRQPLRDEAIVRFLHDTGVRASELGELRMENLDLIERQAIVLGKGNKRRAVFFGQKSARALRAYLRGEERVPTDFVFQAEGGRNVGTHLTRSGLLQLIHRLGKAANIQSVRCSPHTLRHTFGRDFIVNQGDVFALKELMGHTSLQVTLRYVALARTDMQAQHRRCAPGDRLSI